MSNGKGKFVIKPFRPYCAMDGAQATEIWYQLQAAIKQIHNKNASSLSFEELYRNAYNLVLHKHGDLLYRGVCDCVRDHLASVAAGVSSKADEQLLEGISTAWSEHQQTMMMVRDILMYMDRTYCQQGNKVKIYDHGLVIFRETIARNPHVRDRLRGLLLDSVAKERAGQLVERLLVKNSLAMLADLGVDGLSVYEDDFEHAFLETTKEFYRQESLDFLSQNTCPDYLTKAEDRFREEHERVRHYLHPSTEPKLKRVMEEELVTNHAQSLVHTERSGVVAMLKESSGGGGEVGGASGGVGGVNKAVGDLRRLYDLLTRVPHTLDVLRTCVCEFVKKVGEELVSDQEKCKDPVEFVKKLLGMRDKYDVVVAHAFRGEKKAQKKLKEAFEEFINADTRCASFLVLYIDELLRSSLKGVTEDEADAKLEKVIVIFRYLQDKDVFESFYKRYLAKRLLAGKSTSEDNERCMIAKLKTECGYHFTSKLEGMFTDMSMSKETMEQFTEHALQADMTEQQDTSGGGDEDQDVVVLENPLTAGAAASSSSSSSSSASSPPPLVGSLVVVLGGAGRESAHGRALAGLASAAVPSPRGAQQLLRKLPGVLPAEAHGAQARVADRLGKRGPEGPLRRRGLQRSRGLNRSNPEPFLWSNEQPAEAALRAQREHVPDVHLDAVQRSRERDAVPGSFKRARDPGGRAEEALGEPVHAETPRVEEGLKREDVEDGDTFTFNHEFTSKLKRVKIPLVSAKETSVASEALPPAVEEDRRHLVEASIVRIMKSRKVMQHNDLIAEVTRQLVARFSPVPNFIKKRIESLIERDYIERDKDDRRLYTYLA
eukprot:CAMPEP_0171731480 /NCGR_PEP_ID=MMETSP0991-20121206/28962_1 /TAXON_ID=483369 /ORGANISM="non described non described, Strain CCMP2098" /LENGTH=829 /DNA_ID=CAMNT_0012326513 /DNA_START=87 /DNA_END=2577 /DNA_ORIENTATION=-